MAKTYELPEGYTHETYEAMLVYEIDKLEDEIGGLVEIEQTLPEWQIDQHDQYVAAVIEAYDVVVLELAKYREWRYGGAS